VDATRYEEGEMRAAYFPGCSAKSTCRELDVSTRLVAEALGVRLEELEGAGCTGARELRIAGREVHALSNARIMALAEVNGCQSLIVVCDTCLLNLLEAQRELEEDPRLRRWVDRELEKEGLSYTGRVAVKHFVWVLAEENVLSRLRERIARPLEGLRVAPYYGCHIIRPGSMTGGLSQQESMFESLCKVLGCRLVRFSGAEQCCGFHALVGQRKLVLRLAAVPLVNAAAIGADCLVTPCPLCHVVMDGLQPEIEREVGSRWNLPVLHVSQLVGLALGLSPARLGLGRHVTGVDKVLVKLGKVKRTGGRINERRGDAQ
jgi:succinate dehydrogenase / fumarate reductase cytochrome b subunit